MDEMTKKFNELVEEIKSMFTVSQAMAKNSFDSTTFPIEGETYNPDPPPETSLKQQPEPTSLGNTIRRIANNSKCNETDRNIIHQAADRLDAWWKYINELKEEVDLLKQQPNALTYFQRAKQRKRDRE